MMNKLNDKDEFGLSLRDVVDNVQSLPEKSFLSLEKITTMEKIEKGTMLFQSGKINTNIYFVSKGISRGYVDIENTALTFGFFGEGMPLFSILSYVEGTASYENIELLEDCNLYRIRKEDLENLFLKDIFLANWGRKLAEKAFVVTERLMISRQFKSSAERYHEFERENPELLKRVKLKHIASFLGMTQVNLSRLRARKITKTRTSN